MQKNIQIPMDLFLQLVRYHYLNDTDPELPVTIKKGIEDKLEAIIRHQIYSDSKNKAISPEEREKARQRYLDRVGVRDSFRWPAKNDNPS